MLKLKQIARKLGATEGTEILEAAVVLPLAFMLLLGIVEFGRVFNIYSTIQQAAQQGAITAARYSCGTCGNTFPGNFKVKTAVDAVLNSSSLDPAQILVNPDPVAPSFCANPPYNPNTCTTASKIKICRNVLLNPPAGGQPPQCGVIVSFRYPFQFILPFTSLNMSQIVLSAQAQSRMED